MRINQYDFYLILESIHTMIKISKRLSNCFGISEMFLEALKHWLQSKELRGEADQNVRTMKNLLLFIQTLFQNLNDSQSIRFTQILYREVEKISENYDRVVVTKVAERTINLFNQKVDTSKLGIVE